MSTTERDKLKREARDSAISRGHTMSHFENLPSGTAIANCRKCDAIAVVRVRANSAIDMAGSAVASDCKWKRMETI